MALSDYERERIDGIGSLVDAHGARLDAVDKLIDTKVSKDAFMPVKSVIYGLVATIGTAVLGFAFKLFAHASLLGH